MTRLTPRGTLLELPLIQERYGLAFLAAIAFHAFLLVFFLMAPFFMPKLPPVHIGTGPGGGTGGESYTVGIADDLGGGAGLIKPATSPQPPALLVEKPAKKDMQKEAPSKAVPLPDASAKNTKKAVRESAKASKPVPATTSSMIPVAGAKGAGESGATGGGTGGGSGGGNGVSIGSGSGGIGESWYARVVEARIGQAWIKPIIGIQQRVEIVYSFVVAEDGSISKINLEKSSGNDAWDHTALRAINAANPLSPPPPELRGRPLQFTCQFVYPPD